MSHFTFGRHSLRELEGVNLSLTAITHYALTVTAQDFTVHDGMRTYEEQLALVRRGASRTLKSKHLEGRAVDLVPFINGHLRWEWPPIYHIAAAMQEAARRQGVALRWGGVWDRTLDDLGTGPASLKEAVYAYCRRHPGPDFIDGPHFEMVD